MSFRPDNVDEFASKIPTDADYMLDWKIGRYQTKRSDQFAASVSEWIQQLKDDSFKDIPKFCVDSVPNPTFRHVERDIPQRNYGQYFAEQVIRAQSLVDGFFSGEATLSNGSYVENPKRPFKNTAFALNYANVNTLIGKPRTGMSLTEYYLAKELLDIVKPVEAKPDLPFKQSALSFYVKQKLRTL